MYKKLFSTYSHLQADKGKAPLKENKLSDLFDKAKELQDERQVLKDDLEDIPEAINAASKISNGETPSQEENESLLDLKTNYPTFFDSEGEEENSSSIFNRIMGVKGYLRKELRANKKAQFRLLKEINQEQATVEQSSSTGQPNQPVDDTNKAESSSTGQPNQPVDDTSKAESSKRKAVELSSTASDSEESSSSKKTRLSPSDYIDSLPYNPFDDIGID